MRRDLWPVSCREEAGLQSLWGGVEALRRTHLALWLDSV